MEQLPESINFKTLFSYDTVYSADSVEWCPHQPYKNFFVCGTYQLTEKQDEQSNRRLGRIMLFSIGKNELKLHHSLDTAAVLDQKWCPNLINGLPILGVVNAERSIEIYKFENKHLHLYARYSFADNGSETLILSLDWSSGKYECQEPQLVCSDSKGNVHLLTLTLSGELNLVRSFHSHEYEAWIVGFYYWDINVIFSGGDDSLLLKHDMRCETPDVKIRHHQAGVTSFHSNKSKEFVVASGSYDEHVHIWDIRNLKKAMSTIKMPGPLWRLKWDPFCQRFLLAACSYYEHKNISYGADWCFLDSTEVKEIDSSANVIIGSCSFYDHLLCVSKTKCEF
ncbi:diphthine methyltransferase isoform X2 [Anthonomus grandis grandis]|uniref:diphthine methyltransferase isoform X2 n=1 Tax=Anthonomus grandis grandis TaxID=2921223 RepID=UPI0021655585|nr:diphthine methyltransferase isoform X2 [Anthonomus grandis grandis]